MRVIRQLSGEHRRRDAHRLLSQVKEAEDHDGLTSGQEEGQGTRATRRTVVVGLLSGSGVLLAFGLLVPAVWKWPQVSRRAAESESLRLPELGGNRSHVCAALGENCERSRCCRTPGMRCYRKTDGWASCRPWCRAGPDPYDKDSTPWNCTALGPQTPGSPPATDFSLQAADWVKKKCSMAGEDCQKTRCCAEQGKQCFLKQKGWASCKAECSPGPDPEDNDDHPWLCKKIGMRTPGVSSGYGKVAPWVQDRCSAQNENCLHSRCCKDSGLQCFRKRDDWAACRQECTPGPWLTDADPGFWNCTALGGRTPGMPKASTAVRLAPWVKTHCSKKGENCINSRCCADSTMQCYTDSPDHATCRRGCRTKDKTECKKLGSRTPRPWQKPSLYCFSVIQLKTYEASIIWNMIRTDGGAGIFRCEQYDVFASDGEAELGFGPLGPVRTRHFDPAKVGRSVDGTAANTQLFMNVWNSVKWVGRYKLTDWTIKVDPDAVLLADRLRTHLAPHTGKETYIINCNKPFMKAPMMFGSLEAISGPAMKKYFKNSNACLKNYTYGEDRWLADCFRDLGVSGTEDFKMVGDKVCRGDHKCQDGRAAYHHYKSPKKWLACYRAATADTPAF